MELKIILFNLFWSSFCFGQTTQKSVLIHPVFDKYYLCAEHEAGSMPELGDALGTDCFIARHVDNKGRKWLRPYKEDGKSNEDWFGWEQNVLSPIDGIVTKINLNPIVNLPGIKGEGVASFILVKDENNTFVLLAHVRDIKVKKEKK